MSILLHYFGVLCFALFLLICLKILFILRCGYRAYAFVCGVVGQIIILCCCVVCFRIYLMIFFMTFNLLLVLILLCFV